MYSGKPRFPIELFKYKLRERAKLCNFSEDLIDFDSYLDTTLSWQENLATFYHQYPQLAENSDFLKLAKSSSRTYTRDFEAFAKSCGATPEPEKKLVATVTNSGAETVEPEPTLVNELPVIAPIPTLKFEFNTQTISTILEPASTLETSKRERIVRPLPTVRGQLTEAVKKSNIFLIVGTDDQGKSALGSWLLEQHHPERICCVYRHPRPELFPAWVRHIQNWDELPEGAVCLVDEASRRYNQHSNRTPTSQELADKLEIARHNRQSIILISQTSRRLDSDFMYPVDVHLLKEPSEYSRLEERRLIRNAYKKIGKLQGEEPIGVNEFYWLDGRILEKEAFQKPIWFTDELSRAFREARIQSTEKRLEEESRIAGPFSFSLPSLPRIPRIRFEGKKLEQPSREHESEADGRPKFDWRLLGFSALMVFLGLMGLARGNGLGAGLIVIAAAAAKGFRGK
jgi:hypothetical protein